MEMKRQHGEFAIINWQFVVLPYDKFPWVAFFFQFVSNRFDLVAYFAEVPAEQAVEQAAELQTPVHQAVAVAVEVAKESSVKSNENH